MISLSAVISSNPSGGQTKPATQQHDRGGTQQQSKPAVRQQPQVDRRETGETREVVQSNGGKNDPPTWQSPTWKNEIAVADFISFATLIVTAFFLTYTIKTWREMVRANDHAEKANEESSRETQESLSLTRKSNEVTARSVAIAEQQLGAIKVAVRASITVSSFPHMELDEIKQKDIYVVNVTNTGLTPALNFGNRSSFCSITKDPLDVDEIAKNNAQRPSETCILGAGQTSQIPIEMDHPTTEEMAAIRSGAVFYCIQGLLDYDDVFGEHHVTTFRARYDPRQSRWIVSGPLSQPRAVK